MDQYEAVVYSTVGEGTRWWSDPGMPSPIVYGGASYTVPKGYQAWQVGGGGGGGPCTSSSTPTDWVGEGAWGIPSCGGNESSDAARDSADAASGTCCLALPTITGRATRDKSTGDVTIDLSASRLGRISQCGRAKMDITDPGQGQIALKVRQHGSTATAHRELLGQDQCLDLTRATVNVPKGGQAYRDVLVPKSVIRIATTTAHRTPQGAITLTVVAKHFLPACGKRDFDWKSSDGTVPLKVVKVQGATATAKRTLPSGQDCVTDGTILVVQPHDPWSHATREVQAPNPPPSTCSSPGQ